VLQDIIGHQGIVAFVRERPSAAVIDVDVAKIGVLLGFVIDIKSIDNRVSDA
jgi:hypothetical protein